MKTEVSVWLHKVAWPASNLDLTEREEFAINSKQEIQQELEGRMAVTEVEGEPVLI